MSLAIIRRAVQTPTLNAARSIRCNSSTGFSTTLRYYSSKHVLRGSFGLTLPRHEASSAFVRFNVGGLSNVTLNRFAFIWIFDDSILHTYSWIVLEHVKFTVSGEHVKRSLG